MKRRLAWLVSVGSLIVFDACTNTTPTQPTPSTAPTTPTTPQTVISAPIPVAPLNGATSSGWPTFVVTDSVRTGTTATLIYRIDVSTSAAFSSILYTGVATESPGQTSYTPPSSTPAPPQASLYWRAIAIDSTNVVVSPASAVQTFNWTTPPDAAAVIAAQAGYVLWQGAQPPGTPGHAIMGNGWGVGTPVSFNGVTFVSPPIDELQIFDLMDRGMDPQSAIDWMHASGYSTAAAYYPSVNVIGFNYEYLALISGTWNVVLKVGA